MTEVPATATRLARLLVEVERDRAALDKRTADVRRLAARSRDAPLSNDDCIVIAAHLHGWYTAFETLLERIARLVDETVPSGASWHSELVAQMCIDVPGLRPRVLDPVLEPSIAELRKFRHFFRNAYVLELDSGRVMATAATLERVHPQAIAGIDELRAHVRGVLQEISRS